MTFSSRNSNVNWTAIQNTCPEFVLNESDVVLAVIALLGVLMSMILIRRFKSQLKGSIFLFSLAFVDMTCCLLYEYNYFFRSLAIHFKSSTMVHIRFGAMSQVKMIEEFINVFVPLLIFHIVFEKFLWTCTSRTRQTWKIFAVDKFKYLLIIATVAYSFLAMIVMTWEMLLSKSHFCDVLILPLPFKKPVLRFLQHIFIPSVSFLLAPITFIIALITLCRTSRVGEGEKPLPLEELNLANLVADATKLTTGKIKRSILCMLSIYFLFMVRGFCWFVYVNPQTTSITSENRNSRIMRNWSYDFMNVVFSGSRMILYYVFCRRDLVFDYPPNALKDT